MKFARLCHSTRFHRCCERHWRDYDGAIEASRGALELDPNFLLRRAREERCDYLVYLDREPAADALRSDPRFDEIVPRPPSRD